MNKTFQPPTATALYDADKQQLIGVFATRDMAADFVFGRYKNNAAPAMTRAVSNKTVINPARSQHSFRIAARNATPIQKQELGTAFHIIYDETLLPFLASIRADKALHIQAEIRGENSSLGAVHS